jgi:hypothetical protein
MATERGKRKKQKPQKGRPDNPAQSRQFIKAAKELGLTDGEAFKRALDKLVPKKPRDGNS